MEVTHIRTGKEMRLASPQTFLARERSAVEEAWPGDVIGVMDRGNLRIGDSLSNVEGVEFKDIPRFAPEHFARVICEEPMPVAAVRRERQPARVVRRDVGAPLGRGA
jgi:peptide chain release factor 3